MDLLHCLICDQLIVIIKEQIFKYLWWLNWSDWDENIVPFHPGVIVGVFLSEDFHCWHVEAGRCNVAIHLIGNKSEIICPSNMKTDGNYIS